MTTIATSHLFDAMTAYAFEQGYKVTEGAHRLPAAPERWFAAVLCAADARLRQEGGGGCRVGLRQMPVAEGSSNGTTVPSIVETPDLGTLIETMHDILVSCRDPEGFIALERILEKERALA
ncbi:MULTISPECIES: hypothetical protein [Asaia]|uniref:Uncharacterized protein n=1 Tax=Asaia bogorensis TaxID=91915 RepID=A0A060QE13_9PROT|nr:MULTISPECIES: hypothetical protein [Asaia]ETC99468.1 hypothetical protein P792_03245 [Asaia sp. SF2.1]CDG38938.1 hypothetical protein ASAP_0893 [Asaia bogorensis]